MFNKDDAERSVERDRAFESSEWEALAVRAVDAARAAGASYADARLTRVVQHMYRFAASPGNYFAGDTEMTGVGVRALVNGYWGFAAMPHADADTVVRLAQAAVAQGKVNALGSSRPATLAPAPQARGTWTTPLRIDPFSVSIEEKNDYIAAWIETAERLNASIDTIRSGLQFARQERVVATTEGSVFTQRLYESAGSIICSRNGTAEAEITGLEAAGKGWELILDAHILDQLRDMPARLTAESTLRASGRPATIGRYTLVCDGATMASILDQTLGLATQIDRAMGFEANASGTSFIDDPLAMLGRLAVAAPGVTITADRSAPGQLATVKWDDEGVEPKSFTLVKDGVLTDFQTTREQASWLAPYYEKHGRPVASHGCAGSESALAITLQHAPNLAMTPSAGSATLDDLIASVPNGALMTNGEASTDFQARNGTIYGTFRKITNGRVGPLLTGGAISFNTQDLWRNVVSVGGARATDTIASSQYPFGSLISLYGYTRNIKGQPPQITSHTVSAPAAVIAGQAMIDPTRKA
jgi:TldD protein